MTTSIIIPVWNALPYLKEAVAAVRQHTTDYELILVDNGSRPDAVAWINEQESLGVRCVYNETNLGPGAAFNQGIRLANGQFICLLNSDTKVTSGWLQRMVEVSQSDHDIGIVGPLCDNISSVQNMLELAKYNQHIIIPKGYVMPFVCVVIPRWVLTSKGVGMIAERFRMGCSEDSEFCTRLDTAKLLKAVAGQSFVHHALNQSFRDNGVLGSYAVTEMAKLGKAHEELQYLDD